jgi:ATP/maltotriose-dependent transcriptional regulator MalT
MRLARASHAGHYFIQFSSLYAAAQGFRGELDDALRAAQSATDAAQTLGNDQLQAFAEATLAWITSMRGDHESALAAGERAIRAVERAPHALFGWYAYCCHGETLVDAGEYRRGRKVILRAGGEGLERIPPAYRAHWQRSLALAALELGDVEGAAAAARHTDPDLGEKGFPIHQGNGHYVRACAALAAGESALAGERALAAAAEYASGGIPIEEARARLLAGRALATAGEKDAAEQQLREAYDAFVARGAVRLADRTAQELRRLGVSSPKPRVRHRREEASEHLALLTDRERVVAAAVAEGLANREIAARLFVSEKTVEAHLTKIFGKLGVASRTALAGVIAQDQGPHQR